jgi:hypothetical protein
MKRHLLIYVPGLGDHYDPLRRFLLWFWQVYGVKTMLVPMCWRSHESYYDKRARLQNTVDDMHDKGYDITLIGESAGGSMALNAYATRSPKLFRVMTICGKNTQASSVSASLYRKNSAFNDSVLGAEKAVNQLTIEQRHAFISVHPIIDHKVPVRETLIPDCQEVTLWSIGHLATILFSLTVVSWLMVRIATKH